MTGRRTQNTLTALAVAKQKRPGIYGDGAGLSLVITDAGVKRWELRLSSNGHRRQLGLGVYPGVSLDDARRNASALRRDFGQTTHTPSGRRQSVAAAPKAAAVMTFRAAFNDVFEMKAPQLSNPKHAAQWLATMETYVFPSIGRRSIADITGAARALVATLLFADEVGRDVEVGRENTLADAGAVANGANLAGTQFRDLCQAQHIELAHGLLVHHTDAMGIRRRSMHSACDIALILRCHRTVSFTPSNSSYHSADFGSRSSRLARLRSIKWTRCSVSVKSYRTINGVSVIE